MHLSGPLTTEDTEQLIEPVSVSIFISYHTPNVQHRTRFCWFDVRNINCMKKQYTNYSKIIIKKMHTSLLFTKGTNLQDSSSMQIKVNQKKGKEKKKEGPGWESQCTLHDIKYKGGK